MIAIINEMAESGSLSPFAKRVYDNFGPETMRRSVIPVGYGEAAIDYAFDIVKPRRVLEIGTLTGIPSAYMALKGADVITIDIPDDTVNQAIKHEVWELFGVSNRITFKQVKNEAEKERFINGIDFDLCLMDGDHARCTYSDWMMVRKCGAVLFHEYWHKQPPVKSLVDSLKGRIYKGDTFAGPWALWTN
jgi:SAM-dependent methyltransferase